MRDPNLISIFMTSPHINLAISRVMSEVWDVVAKFEKDRTLQVWARVVRFFLKIFRGRPSAFNSNPLPGRHRWAASSSGTGL